MAKDGNDGRKAGQENSSNGRSHKRNERRPPTNASKANFKARPATRIRTNNFPQAQRRFGK